MEGGDGWETSGGGGEVGGGLDIDLAMFSAGGEGKEGKGRGVELP